MGLIQKGRFDTALFLWYWLKIHQPFKEKNIVKIIEEGYKETPPSENNGFTVPGKDPTQARTVIPGL